MLFQDIEIKPNIADNSLIRLELSIIDPTYKGKLIIPESISRFFINEIKYGKYYMIKNCIRVSRYFYATVETQFIEMKKFTPKKTILITFDIVQDFMKPQIESIENFDENIETMNSIDYNLSVMVKRKSAFKSGSFELILYDNQENPKYGEIKAIIPKANIDFYGNIEEGMLIKITKFDIKNRNEIIVKEDTIIQPISYYGYHCNLDVYFNTFNANKELSNMIIIQKKRDKNNLLLKLSNNLECNSIIYISCKDVETFNSLQIGHIYNVKCNELEVIDHCIYYKGTEWEDIGDSKISDSAIPSHTQCKTSFIEFDNDKSFTGFLAYTFKSQDLVIRKRYSFVGGILDDPFQFDEKEQLKKKCTTYIKVEMNSNSIICIISDKIRDKIKITKSQTAKICNAKLTLIADKIYFLLDKRSSVIPHCLSFLPFTSYFADCNLPNSLGDLISGKYGEYKSALTSKSIEYQLISHDPPTFSQTIVLSNEENDVSCVLIGHDISVFDKIEMNTVYKFRLSKTMKYEGKLVFSLDNGEIVKNENSLVLGNSLPKSGWSAPTVNINKPAFDFGGLKSLPNSNNNQPAPNSNNNVPALTFGGSKFPLNSNNNQPVLNSNNNQPAPNSNNNQSAFNSNNNVPAFDFGGFKFPLNSNNNQPALNSNNIQPALNSNNNQSAFNSNNNVPAFDFGGFKFPLNSNNNQPALNSNNNQPALNSNNNQSAFNSNNNQSAFNSNNNQSAFNSNNNVPAFDFGGFKFPLNSNNNQPALNSNNNQSAFNSNNNQSAFNSNNNQSAFNSNNNQSALNSNNNQSALNSNNNVPEFTFGGSKSLPNSNNNDLALDFRLSRKDSP